MTTQQFCEVTGLSLVRISDHRGEVFIVGRHVEGEIEQPPVRLDDDLTSMWRLRFERPVRERPILHSKMEVLAIAPTAEQAMSDALRTINAERHPAPAFEMLPEETSFLAGRLP